jgi:hypothetical protein
MTTKLALIAGVILRPVLTTCEEKAGRKKKKRSSSTLAEPSLVHGKQDKDETLFVVRQTELLGNANALCF